MKKWIIGLLVSLAASFCAHADNGYPDRPVTLVVGFSAGGSTDVVARILAQKASELLGKQIIVENKTGAGGVIATDYVAKSKPDGYTVLFGTSAYPIAASLYKKLPYDPAKALEPVTLVAEVPLVLVVHPSVKVNSAHELVELLRKNPGRHNYGSSGNGSALHLAVELLKYQEKVSALHIPFRGAAPALQSLIAGDLQFMMDAVSTAAQMVNTGKLRGLAATSARRSSTLPDLPTMKEAGFPEYETGLWNMLMVPQGTPPEVIEKLNIVFQQAIQDKGVRERFAKLGIEPVDGSDPAKARKHMASEMRRWADVIKAANIQPD